MAQLLFLICFRGIQLRDSDWLRLADAKETNDQVSDIGIGFWVEGFWCKGHIGLLSRCHRAPLGMLSVAPSYFPNLEVPIGVANSSEKP